VLGSEGLLERADSAESLFDSLVRNNILDGSNSILVVESAVDGAGLSIVLKAAIALVVSIGLSSIVVHALELINLLLNSGFGISLIEIARLVTSSEEKIDTGAEDGEEAQKICDVTVVESFSKLVGILV
jgi:hypothetical protein